MKPHKYSHLLSALVLVARKYHNFDSLREHLNVVLSEFVPVEHDSKGAPEHELRIVSAIRLGELVSAASRLERAESVLRLLRCAARDWDYTGKINLDPVAVFGELAKLDAAATPEEVSEVSRRIWRDFTAGWSAARTAPEAGDPGADAELRDSVAERWIQSMLRIYA